jgi:hypothetical protein
MTRPIEQPPDPKPPLPRWRRVIAFGGGGVLAAFVCFVLGLLLLNIKGAIETTPRRSPIAIGVFALTAIVAVLSGIPVVRSRTARPFLLGLCIGFGVASLIEGLCFLG